MDISFQAGPGFFLFSPFLLAFVDDPSWVDITTGVFQSMLIATHGLASRVFMQRKLPPRAHGRTHESLVTNWIQRELFHPGGLTTRIPCGGWESAVWHCIIELVHELLFSFV